MSQNTYSSTFYKNQRKGSASSAMKILQLVKTYIPFSSAVDIGCGVGEWLKVCSELGAEKILGLDGSWVDQSSLAIPSDCFHAFDLSTPISFMEKGGFDLTISMEVAEHISPEKVEIYLDNVTRFSNVILFSAAIPRQGGTHHVNEQWPSYWIEKFNRRGFVPVDCLREQIWNDSSIEKHYRQNVMLFVKKDRIDNYPALRQVAEKPVLDLVHPDFWLGVSGPDKMSFMTLLKCLMGCLIFIIPAFLKAVKRRLGNSGLSS